MLPVAEKALEELVLCRIGEYNRSRNGSWHKLEQKSKELAENGVKQKKIHTR